MCSTVVTAAHVICGHDVQNCTLPRLQNCTFTRLPLHFPLIRRPRNCCVQTCCRSGIERCLCPGSLSFLFCSMHQLLWMGFESLSRFAFARTVLWSRLQLCSSDAKGTSLLNNASKESSSDLKVTVSSRLFGHELLHDCHQANLLNPTKSTMSVREFCILTFLHKPTANIFNALALERILHVSEHCDAPAAPSRIVPVVKPTPGFQSLTFSTVSVATIPVASREEVNYA